MTHSGDGRYFLSDGYAAAECFPGEALSDISRDILRTRASVALQYGPRAGYAPLRELIATWLQEEGIDASAEEIAIVTGAKQGLDIVAHAFAKPGDILAGSQPTYMSGLRIFSNAGLTVQAVGSDADGTLVDEIEKIMSRPGGRARFIYEIPDFQNPTGTVLSEERRERLVAIATRHGVPILEDNPYRWLRYEGASVRPLKAFDHSGVVLSVGSFAKILGPGLRLGWVHARSEHLARILVNKADAGTSPLTQMIAYEFFRPPGALRAHLERIRQTLRPRRDQMLASLKQLSYARDWSRPSGGYYVWVRLDDATDGDDLTRRAAQSGIECYPGSLFFSDGRGRNFIRLSYSHETPDRIEGALGILAGL